MTTTSSLHHEMQGILDAWAAAIVADDADRIAAFADPEWVLVTPESGPVTLGGFCQAVRSGDLSHAAMEFTVLDARRHGDVVTVRAHGTNHGTFRGEPFQADEWVTEVFVRHEDGWRCTVSALTPRDPAGSRVPGGITPYLCVDDTRQALTWYATALGARPTVEPIVMPDGRVGHAEITLGSHAAVMLSDPFPELLVDIPAPGRGAAVTLHLDVADVDVTVAAAAASGAIIDREPESTDHCRVAVLRDPFGHRWMLNARTQGQAS